MSFTILPDILRLSWPACFTNAAQKSLVRNSTRARVAYRNSSNSRLSPSPQFHTWARYLKPQTAPLAFANRPSISCMRALCSPAKTPSGNAAFFSYTLQQRPRNRIPHKFLPFYARYEALILDYSWFFRLHVNFCGFGHCFSLSLQYFSRPYNRRADICPSSFARIMRAYVIGRIALFRSFPRRRFFAQERVRTQALAHIIFIIILCMPFLCAFNIYTCF